MNTATKPSRLREASRLSQAALGRYIGLTTGYVSQLERGARQARESTRCCERAG